MSFRLQLFRRSSEFRSVKVTETRYWEKKIDTFKNKWFIDKKGQLKRGVGWSEKEGFIKDIRSELEGVLPLPKISIIINEGLKKLNRDLIAVNENYCKYSDKVLEIKIENILDGEIYSIQDFIERNSNSNEHRPTVVKGIKESLKSPLAALLKERSGDILLEEVVLFKNKISLIIEHSIYYIFNEQIDLLNQTFTKILSVYNEFLERQERYQQETPKQREAEKAWIDLQRHQLRQIQMGIEEILQSEGI